MNTGLQISLLQLSIKFPGTILSLILESVGFHVTV